MKRILTLLFLTIFINQGYSQQFIDFNQGGIKEESYYSVIPYKNVGGLIMVEAGKLLVTTVWSESLKDQIKGGDQSLTVNGVDVIYLNKAIVLF